MNCYILSIYLNILEIQVNIYRGALFQLGDRRGQTPLHVAAKYNRIAIAQLLIREGVTVHITDDVGVSPFHIACMEGNESIAELLIMASKSVDVIALVVCSFNFSFHTEYNCDRMGSLQ